MGKQNSNGKPFGFSNTNRRFPKAGRRTSGEVARDRFAFDQAMQGNDCTRIRRGGDFVVQKRDFLGEPVGEPMTFQVKTGNSKVTEAEQTRQKKFGRNRYRLVRY
ncbi:MAG: hypothetical protein NWF00_03180 [Candidatus Bathyarchaeota archaeon]|nr:hypothetical protein [Candidatus Bathyarchaeota archaeon]